MPDRAAAAPAESAEPAEAGIAVETRKVTRSSLAADSTVSGAVSQCAVEPFLQSLPFTLRSQDLSGSFGNRVCGPDRQKQPDAAQNQNQSEASGC